MAQEYNKTFGVFKPVGHVVISFPTADEARATARELDKLDVQGDAVRFLTDREMLAQIDGDLENASPLAGVGQELNLIKSHQALAEEGFHFLVVRAKTTSRPRRSPIAPKPMAANVPSITATS